MIIYGSDKIVVIRSVYVISVIYIDESGMITVISAWVIIYIHTPKTIYPTIIITNIDIPDPGYPSIIIIIDWNVLYLDYGTVVIVLNIRIVIITGIKGDVCSTQIYTGIYADPIVNIKIELPIGINGKSDSIFLKNKRIAISVNIHSITTIVHRIRRAVRYPKNQGYKKKC
jgi:hypothetical protein